jgi:hypothetical protein
MVPVFSIYNNKSPVPVYVPSIVTALPEVPIMPTPVTVQVAPASTVNALVTFMLRTLTSVDPLIRKLYQEVPVLPHLSVVPLPVIRTQ